MTKIFTMLALVMSFQTIATAQLARQTSGGWSNGCGANQYKCQCGSCHSRLGFGAKAAPGHNPVDETAQPVKKK